MPSNEISGFQTITFPDWPAENGHIVIQCTSTDSAYANNPKAYEFTFNLQDMLINVDADGKIKLGETGFWTNTSVNKNRTLMYWTEGGPHSILLCYAFKLPNNIETVLCFELLQIFHCTTTLTLKTKPELLAMDPIWGYQPTPFPKKHFDGQSLSPEGIFSLSMRDISGKTNRSSTLTFDLDKVIGLSNRQLTAGQTGFFSKGLTKGIHLDSQDGWTLRYRVYPAPGESDWSTERTYDLSHLFELDDRLRLKAHPEMGDVKAGSPAKQEQPSTDEQKTPGSANDRDAPPKYQPDLEAKNQELAKIKKSLDQAKKALSDSKSENDQLRKELTGAKEDAALSAKRLNLKVDELKSKLRTARSTARTEIASLERVIGRLREEVGDYDGEDGKSDDEADGEDKE